MAKQVDFFFGLGSRYSYLASTQIAALEKDTGCVVSWRPMFGNDLMDRRGQNPFVQEAGAKLSGQYDEEYRRTDLRRWADLYGVPYAEPLAPLISAKRRTLYCVAATLRGVGPAYARAMFASIFIEGAATTDAVCLNLAKILGLDLDALSAIVDSGEAERAHEETIGLGLKYHVFGVPSFVVDDALFWGNDRLVLLRRHLIQSNQ